MLCSKALSTSWLFEARTCTSFKTQSSWGVVCQITLLFFFFSHYYLHVFLILFLYFDGNLFSRSSFIFFSLPLLPIFLVKCILFVYFLFFPVAIYTFFLFCFQLMMVTCFHISSFIFFSPSVTQNFLVKYVISCYIFFFTAHLCVREEHPQQTRTRIRWCFHIPFCVNIKFFFISF